MTGVLARVPAIRLPLWTVANALALAFIVAAWTFLQRFIGDGIDAHAYWLTRDGIDYGRAGEADAYLYSPVFAQVLRPLTLLDWPIFYGAWTSLLIGSLVLMVGPLAAAVLLALPPVSGEIITGNVHLLLAAAVVFGLRNPAWWAFPLLTKVTPGVGLLWFAIRREWRAVRTALLATAGLVLASFALDPGAWSGWVQALASSSSVPSNSVPVPLAVRLPIAVALVAVGAWRGWRWTVLVAAALAMPVLWTYQWRWAVMLVGLLPFLADRVRAHRVLVARRGE